MTFWLVFCITALIIIAFFCLRWLRQPPKAGSQVLAMVVWAAFGPYETAHDAEEGLRRSSRVVFGSEKLSEHKEWIQGHSENFKKWETEGRFAEVQNFERKHLLHPANARGPAFEKACQNMRDEIVNQGLQAMERLNKDFLEKGGHKLEATEQPDGTIGVEYKQTWSDEEIKRSDRELIESIANNIGRKLTQDQSHEAQKLSSFLGAIHLNAHGTLPTPRDVGAMWCACLTFKDKDSESFKEFKALSDAWLATQKDLQGQNDKP